MDTARKVWLFGSAVLLGGCITLRADFVRESSAALPPGAVAESIAKRLADHPGEDGFRLLVSNTDALMTRLNVIDHAESSIDLQYYIFHNDSTGRLVAQRLLAAADRGVRVRMLLDDLSAAKVDRQLAALDAHPNVEVRLFNPFKLRGGAFFGKAVQFIFDGRRLNRRMHNKSLIGDGIVAIVGGRNIGDEYFDAARDMNFSDLDVAAIGPIVGKISMSFDDYWNCEAAFPVAAFRGLEASADDLARLRVVLQTHARAFAQTDYAQALLDTLPDPTSTERRDTWVWGPAALVADQPEKVDPDRNEAELRLGPQIKALFDATQHEMLLISPYFIPGKDGTRYLGDIARRGVALRVLTNSLGSSDEPVVYAAYSRYREPLLAAGTKLYELKPAPGAPQRATAGGKSSGVSLHAKAFVLDGRYTFVGSLNMDQRSRLLNTEMGVVVDSPALAKAVHEFFDAARGNAYEVVLRPPHAGAAPRLLIIERKDDTEVVHEREPGVTTLRRIEAAFAKLLPIEGLL